MCENMTVYMYNAYIHYIHNNLMTYIFFVVILTMTQKGLMKIHHTRFIFCSQRFYIVTK